MNAKAEIRDITETVDADFVEVPEPKDDAQLSLEREKKTDKPDNPTVEITNDEFLATVFGDPTSSARPVVVSFAGNPASVAKIKWFGKPWIPGKTPTPTSANNYFSLAAFSPDDEGKYRRKKVAFARLFAIMLDDVGTKVPLDRLTLQPSWLLETSPGNCQAGYLLDTGLTDAATADALMKAIIDADLCDPGAGGPCARLARLPIGVNGKRLLAVQDGKVEGFFAVRLFDWRPELRYSPEALAEGLQFELGRAERQASAKAPSASVVADGDEDVYVPRSDENPVVTALRERGLYKQPLGGGKHDITCPWVHEHTDAADSGTAYFEPSETYPLGGFKCQHGHCADRRMGALLRFLGIERATAKHKPTIRVSPGELPAIADAAERELAASGRHYQRGGVIVTVSTDPGTKATAVKLVPLPALTRALAGAAVWMRFDKRMMEWVPADPGEKYVRAVLDATDYAHMPVLNGIARQPYLRADGTLMTLAGYDQASGMFGAFVERDFPIPAKPTWEDALRALTELSSLLDEFAFAKPSDRAAALAGILTAAIRPSLPAAPMFHVRAPQIASGKSYICALLTAFATPQPSTPHSFPADDEECRKLLLAELMRAPAVVEFDNLTSDLIPHKSLCTALTSEFISGRILGVSKTAEPGTRALFLSSGNNVGPVRDMARRTVTIDLDPAVEVPAAREFKRDPVGEVRASRGMFVALALTVVRAWIVAGRPKADVCKPLASYEEWTDLCRRPLIWLGLEDPAASVFAGMAEDPDRETLGALLAEWSARYSKPIKVKQVVADADRHENADLLEVLREIAGERDGSINNTRLGRWIKRHAGRVVDGRRFVAATSTTNAAMWAVEKIAPVGLSGLSSSFGASSEFVTDEKFSEEATSVMEGAV